MGALAGEYHLVLDESVRPVRHPPRRVPVAIRERLRETLGDLEMLEIIARVTTPTLWISSMIVVPKKNSKLRICLDAMDLNSALQRETYSIPAIEEVASCLHGAKVFTSLDVSNGYGILFLMKSLRFVLRLIRLLEHSAGKGCCSESFGSVSA